MAGFTLAERNRLRDATDGRIALVKFFDSGGTNRYTSAYHSKTLSDGQIIIVQNIQASELNNYVITRLQVTQSDSSPLVDVTFTPSLDKRTTSPYYNVAVIFTISLRF